MKTIFVFLLIVICNFSNAEDPKDEKNNSTVYNLTIGASTPAFTILDLAPSDVERPRDPNNFAVTLQSATENLSVIPKNYALEVAPILIYSPVKSYTELISRNFWDNIKQSLTLSLATTTDETQVDKSSTTRMGLGLKMSLVRGCGDPEPPKEYAKELGAYLTLVNTEREKIKDSDVAYSNKFKVLKERKDTLRKKISMLPDSIKNDPSSPIMIAVQIQMDEVDMDELKVRDELNKEVDKKLLEERKKLKEKVSKMEFVRPGPKLDLSFALSYDFPEQKYSKRKFTGVGTWLVFGGESSTGGSRNGNLTYLCLLKYLAKKNLSDSAIKSDELVSNFDFGARLIYSYKNFSFSGEVIGRKESAKSTQSKYLIELGYNVGENKLLLFSFGKEFDGTPYKTGNVIAALNLLLGFGSARPVPTDDEAKKTAN